VARLVSLERRLGRRSRGLDRDTAHPWSETPASTDSARAISSSCCSDVLRFFTRSFGRHAADDVEKLGSPPANALPIRAAEPGSRHMAEINVLANAELAEEAGMFGASPRCRRVRRQAATNSLSGVPTLSRAVLTKEREYLSRNEIENTSRIAITPPNRFVADASPAGDSSCAVTAPPLDKVVDIATGSARIRLAGRRNPAEATSREGGYGG
jgi:hypothetical protein